MSEWISVTDRLPPSREDVLVWDGEDYSIIWYDTYFETWALCLDVTHWMPLPEPPKEEEQ